MVKLKLTLSVDKEVIEKAKRLGINISDITEKVLKGYTSAEKPEGNLYEGYKELFDSITPLLKEFNVDITVAEDYVDVEGGSYSFGILLTSDGDFWNDFFENSFEDIEEIKIRAFLSPKKILANLVDALVRSKEAQEKQMREILMAKRIVDAMAQTLTKPRKRSENKKKPTTKVHSKEKENP